MALEALGSSKTPQLMCETVTGKSHGSTGEPSFRKIAHAQGSGCPRARLDVGLYSLALCDERVTAGSQPLGPSVHEHSTDSTPRPRPLFVSRFLTCAAGLLVKHRFIPCIAQLAFHSFARARPLPTRSAAENKRGRRETE